MKRTSGLMIMVVGMLLLSSVVPARALLTAGSATSRTALSKTAVVPAEDSGDDGDDTDSDDAE